MSKIIEEAIRKGRAAGEAVYYASLARKKLVQLAQDQARGDPQASRDLKGIAAFIRSLPREQRNQLLALLRGEGPELSEQDWEANDGDPVENLGLSQLDDLAMTKSDGEKSFDAMFKDARRIQPGDQFATRQPPRERLAADSAALDSFEQMFPQSKRLN